VLEEPLTVEKGHFHVPEGPGLGVSLNMEVAEKYRVA